MCFHNRQLDAKTRRIFAAGNVCLFTGLTLNLFFHPASHAAQNIQHAAVGFLLGLAIVFNLHAARCARRGEDRTH